MARSPVAGPNRIAPVAHIIASDDDSWLLPAPKPAWPDAQEFPAYGSKWRRNGNRVSVRSQLSHSFISSLTIPPKRAAEAHDGSCCATIAAASTKYP